MSSDSKEAQISEQDSKENYPKWSFNRIRFNLPVQEGGINRFPRVGQQPKTDDDPDWRGVVKSKVERWPEPEEPNIGKYQTTKYQFFDTPDYADPFKKLSAAHKFFLKAALIYGPFVAHFRGIPFTFPSIYKVLVKHSLPVYTSGMFATACVISAANLRGNKDDYNNYILGGAVFGLLRGHKNYARWLTYTLISVPVACYIKYVHEYNVAVWPISNPRSFGYGTLSGLSAETGSWRDGDLRFGLRSIEDEPGRDVRQPFV